MVWRAFHYDIFCLRWQQSWHCGCSGCLSFITLWWCLVFLVLPDWIKGIIPPVHTDRHNLEGSGREVLNIPNVTFSYSSTNCKIISLLLHNFNFAIVMNCNVNVWNTGYMICDSCARTIWAHKGVSIQGLRTTDLELVGGPYRRRWVAQCCRGGVSISRRQRIFHNQAFSGSLWNSGHTLDGYWWINWLQAVFFYILEDEDYKQGSASQKQWLKLSLVIFPLPNGSLSPQGQQYMSDASQAAPFQSTLFLCAVSFMKSTHANPEPILSSVSTNNLVLSASFAFPYDRAAHNSEACSCLYGQTEWHRLARL